MTFLGELRVEATIENLRMISYFLQSIGQRLYLTEKTLFDFELAVEEAAVNIIKHAYKDHPYGEMLIGAVVIDSTLSISLTDWGNPFNPSNLPTFDMTAPIENRVEGGMGLHIIHRLMDYVVRDVSPDGLNILTLSRHIEQLPPDVHLPSTLRELNAMLSVSQFMSAGVELDALLAMIIDKLVETLGAEGGTLFLIDEERGELFSRVLLEHTSGLEEIRIKIGEGIAGYVAETGQIMNIGEAYKDPRFARGFDQQTGYQSRTILAAPLRNSQQKIIGVVELLNKKGGEFSSRDERLLIAMASQAAISIENSRLHAQEVRQQLVNKDLETARRIQQSFLPQSVPQRPGWEIAAYWQPMRAVGGDFYDFYAMDDGRLAVAIADVTDKGVPAALFMALSVTVLRFAMTLNFSPSEMMNRANQVILANQRSSMFTTAFVSYLDWETGIMDYASAGHNPPVFYHAKTRRCELLNVQGVALGVFKSATYQEKRIQLESGDVCVLYTDGITEIINSSMEEFGEDRLEQVILQNAHRSAYELVEAIAAANDDFSEGLGDFDDETLIVIKKL